MSLWISNETDFSCWCSPWNMHFRSLLSICCIGIKFTCNGHLLSNMSNEAFLFPMQRLSLFLSHPFTSFLSPIHLRGNSMRNETIECDSLCQDTLPRDCTNSNFTPTSVQSLITCAVVFSYSFSSSPLNRIIEMQLFHVFIRNDQFGLSIQFYFQRLHQHFSDTITDSKKSSSRFNPCWVLSSTILLK